MVQPGFEQRWRDAEQIADAAFRDLAPAARRLRRRMNRQQYTQYVFSENRGVTPIRADTYLAVKEVTTPDADYPNVRRFDSVTPGHTWHLRRQDPETPDTTAAAATIRLFVTPDRTPMLRCDERLEPVSRDAWESMAETVLEPLRERRARVTGGLIGLLFTLVFTTFGWLLIGLAVLVLMLVFFF